MKIVIFIICISVLAQCHGKDVAYTASAEVQNYNVYTFDAYRKIFDGTKNFVFSPLSLRVIYNILYQGATGDADKSLKSLLFHESSPLLKQNVIEGQRDNLNNIWSSPNVQLANKLYLADGAILTDNFQEIVTKYRSDYEYVDFRKGAEIAGRMNHWVENKTHGLIRNLVSPNEVNPTSRLFAINTLYFKADWASPYHKNNIKTDTFNSVDGTTGNVEYIEHRDYYSFAQFDDVKVDVLEIPYESPSGFVFWMVLPRKDSSLVKLSGQLNNVLFQRIGNSLTPHYVHIKFPVLTIESEVDGIQISPESFEKSEFDVLKNVGALKVGVIKQKAKIIVNTKGTEASAATFSQLFFLIADSTPDEVKEFIADRPFLFAIVAKSTNQPIFVGHYAHAPATTNGVPESPTDFVFMSDRYKK